MNPAELLLDGRVRLHVGDMLDVLATLPECSVDSVVCDPPYHLTSIVKRFGGKGAAPAQHGTDGAFARASRGFMGQQWDGGDVAFRVETWAAVMRVLKPGGHLVAFAAAKNAHLLTVAIEAAGFEVRDDLEWLVDPSEHARAFLASLSAEQLDALMLAVGDGGVLGRLFWMYGCAMPKSHAVSKAIDKLKGAERKVVAEGRPVKRMIPGAEQAREGWEKTNGRIFVPTVTAPGCAEAAAWEGWGTALKPAHEPIVLARKPLSEGSVAANVLKWGTGAINVDGCRVPSSAADQEAMKCVVGFNRSYGAGESGIALSGSVDGSLRRLDRAEFDPSKGRWPATVLHDGSDEVVAAFPAEAGAGGPASGPSLRGRNDSVSRGHFNGLAVDRSPAFHGDSGSAARFFFSAKADGDDRLGSKHPTVKPVDLMQWLVRLVTPPKGVVLDPFAGTGTTGEAAWREGFDAILVEREPTFAEDIRRRMALALAGPATRKAESVKARGTAADAGPLFALDGAAVDGPGGG